MTAGSCPTRRVEEEGRSARNQRLQMAESELTSLRVSESRRGTLRRVARRAGRQTDWRSAEEQTDSRTSKAHTNRQTKQHTESVCTQLSHPSCCRACSPGSTFHVSGQHCAIVSGLDAALAQDLVRLQAFYPCYPLSIRYLQPSTSPHCSTLL